MDDERIHIRVSKEFKDRIQSTLDRENDNSFKKKTLTIFVLDAVRKEIERFERRTGLKSRKVVKK